MTKINNMAKIEDVKNLGIYIHVPFCIQKCLYCGFYSEGGNLNGQREDEYLQGIIEDIVSYGKEYPGYIVDSVFIGGGTPSVLRTESVFSILEQLKKSFDFAEDTEITIETNPGTVDFQKLLSYKQMGINRLSLGCQSFDNDTLKRLGRIHRAEDIEKSFKDARKAGFDNINLDIMFAVPGHTMEIWDNTLKQTMNLYPEHISFYSLQIEEGTPFYNMYKKGILEELDVEEDRRMYHHAIEVFKSHGYEHYEISNCAKPGKKCRHNLKYWSMDSYIGIGPTASSYIEGARFTDGPNPEFHENSLMDDASEFMFTGLRKTEGIKFKDFKDKVGKDYFQIFGDRQEELDEFIETGNVVMTHEGIKLTETGIDISNKIMTIFV